MHSTLWGEGQDPIGGSQRNSVPVSLYDKQHHRGIQQTYWNKFFLFGVIAKHLPVGRRNPQIMLTRSASCAADQRPVVGKDLKIGLPGIGVQHRDCPARSPTSYA